MSPVLGTGIQKNCRWNKQNLIITGTIGAGTGTGVKKNITKILQMFEYWYSDEWPKG
jgi:hypothetical protein